MEPSPLPAFLESHIDQIAEAVAERARSNAEQGGNERADQRAAVREAIRTVVEREAPPPEPAGVPPAPPPPPPTGAAGQPLAVLPAYLREGDADPAEARSVEQLVSTLLSHGLVRAVRAAEHESPAVCDAFHDALVDIVIPELKRRGRWEGA